MPNTNTINTSALNGNVSCKYRLPCGYCELKKEQCSMYPNITYIPHWDTTPINTKKWEVGDWPPGPQPTCKDLASNPDTFRVHFEDLPKYSTDGLQVNSMSDNLTYSQVDKKNGK